MWGQVYVVTLINTSRFVASSLSLPEKINGTFLVF